MYVYWNSSDSKVHEANMGPTGPRWAQCWPCEPCYLGAHWSYRVAFLIRLCKDPTRFHLTFQHFVSFQHTSRLARQIIGNSIVYSTACPVLQETNAGHHRAFARGNRRWPVDSPLKRPALQKVFPWHDVIITHQQTQCWSTVPLVPWQFETMISFKLCVFVLNHVQNIRRDLIRSFCT